MKKRFLLFIFILILLLCTACGVEKGDQDKNEGTQNSEETIVDLYPMTIVDQAGREVVIESQPKSLVSSYYITTSALLALDLKAEIKGVESNPEKRSLYKLCAPELFEVTQVGSPKEFDLEACASVKPDLVILPLRAKDMVKPLEDLGITVMVVNPESQDEIFKMLQLIGQATGREKRAEELVSYIQNKIDFVKDKMLEVDTPLVYLGGNSSFFSTASKGMYQNDLISLAGGKNVASQIDDTYWVEVSYEQILDWNPEYIIMASEASYSMEEIQGDENLAYCQAIENNKVYKIPSDIEDWDSPVPSSFLGVAYLANVLHPDLISSEQYQDMVKEYYETFYGFTCLEK